VRRNAETVLPLGMATGLQQVWDAANREAGRAQLKGSDVAGLFGTLSRIARMALQSMVLALGAYLVIAGEATGGVMIAASIMLGRALAPVELAIAHWKGFVGARQGFHRLRAALVCPTARSERVTLPAPRQTLSVEHVSVGPAGARQAIVRDVAFELKAGDALGIIGPSGSGKSTLARALVGLWSPQRGSIRLDGSVLDQWSREEAGRFLGYLPQAIELFSGTIAQNIARFDPAPGSDEVLKAAAAAGVDTLVRRMPDGFETQVGEAGQLISAGQRQRIALARALFRDPFLVVLDEPNSNLDADGEAALTEAIMGVRRRGGIAVVIAHRPSALAAANLVLMMADGQAQAFGPKDQVLRKVLAHPVAPAAVRLREAAE
jgi:PrtD family type I secretion system ABC transporter